MNQHVDRRSLLAGIAVAPATVAAPAIASAATLSGIAAAIEAHKAAEKAFHDALDREQDAEEDYFSQYPRERIVPLSVCGGISFNVRFNLDQYQADCLDQIKGHYDRLFSKLKELRLAPELDDAALASLKSKQRADLATLRKMRKAEDANRNAHGYGLAEAERDRTSSEEREALHAVCACPCATPEEYDLKGRYLQKALSRTVIDDEDQMALFASMVIGGGVS